MNELALKSVLFNGIQPKFHRLFFYDVSTSSASLEELRNSPELKSSFLGFMTNRLQLISPESDCKSPRGGQKI